MAVDKKIFTGKKEVEEQMEKVREEESKSEASRLSESEIKSVIMSQVRAYFNSVQSTEQLLKDLERPLSVEGDSILEYGVKLGLVNAIGEAVSAHTGGLTALSRKVTEGALAAQGQQKAKKYGR